MQVSDTALFFGKGKVWNRSEQKPEEFSSAVDLWEEDRDFLAKHSSYKMDIGDQHFAILTMCPADTRQEILRTYSLKKYPTYLLLKQAIRDELDRVKEINKNSKGIQ